MAATRGREVEREQGVCRFDRERLENGNRKMCKCNVAEKREHGLTRVGSGLIYGFRAGCSGIRDVRLDY